MQLLALSCKVSPLTRSAEAPVGGLSALWLLSMEHTQPADTQQQDTCRRWRRHVMHASQRSMPSVLQRDGVGPGASPSGCAA